MRPPSLRISVAAGVAAIAAYLAMAVFGSGGLIVRPLYDGTGPPPPYRWVKPPPDLAAGNQPPESATDKIAFEDGQSEAFTVQTPDGQAAVTLPLNALAPKEGETHVRVTITPRDPEAIGSPPAGQQFDGNAYEFAFVYDSSGQPAPMLSASCPPANSGQPTQCISIAMRHPISANALYRRDGEAWVKLDVLTAPFQLFGDSPKAGVFVATGPKGEEPSKTGDYIAIGAGVAATLIAIVAGRIIPKRRRTKARAARAPGRARKRGPSPKKGRR